MKKTIILLLLCLSLLHTAEKNKSIVSSDGYVLSYAMEDYAQRVYLQKDMLQPLLGMSNREGEGIVGLERSLSALLKKENSVRLTIDLAMQYRVEQILDRYKQRLQADDIIVGVMESHTGKLRVLASSNRYDPNSVTEADIPNLFQKFSDYPYEPGAVMMPFVIASALQRGFVDTNTLIDTHEKRFEVGNGRYMTDSTHNDLLTPGGILKNSSNIGTAKVAFMFSGYEFRESLVRFGLHQPTTIELPEDAKGFLQSREKFEDPVYRANTAYGYGMLATFMQLLDGYNVFNNEGMKVAPHLVQSLIGREGNTTLAPHAIPVQVIDRQTNQKVHEMLVANIAKGRTLKEKYKTIETGGMGSTAYIAKNGRYVREYHSSFYGFANDAQGKRYTIGVLLVRPKMKGMFYASRSAFPVFKQVVEVLVEGGLLMWQ